MSVDPTRRPIAAPPRELHVRMLGARAYEPVWRAMQAFTGARDDATADELWVVEHAPVYTLGLNGKPEHLLDAGDIAVVHCDRGGQVTYHGPGQLVIYCLVDLRRAGLGVKNFVSLLESATIETLARYGVRGMRRADAPGVYVDGAKIMSLGLRIRRGMSYHGLSLNLDMDLEPFARIHPCGFADLEVTQLRELVPGPVDRAAVTDALIGALALGLGLEPRSVREAAPHTAGAGDEWYSEAPQPIFAAQSERA